MVLQTTASVSCDSGERTIKAAAFLKKNGWDQGQGPLFGARENGLAFAARWLTRSGKPLRVPVPGDPKDGRSARI